MRGMERERGVAKTVWRVFPVVRVVEREVRSMWQTYLDK